VAPQNHSRRSRLSNTEIGTCVAAAAIAEVLRSPPQLRSSGCFRTSLVPATTTRSRTVKTLRVTVSNSLAVDSRARRWKSTWAPSKDSIDTDMDMAVSSRSARVGEAAQDDVDTGSAPLLVRWGKNPMSSPSGSEWAAASARRRWSHASVNGDAKPATALCRPEAPTVSARRRGGVGLRTGDGALD
jgi:hypothetical protein